MMINKIQKSLIPIIITICTYPILAISKEQWEVPRQMLEAEINSPNRKVELTAAIKNCLKNITEVSQSLERDVSTTDSVTYAQCEGDSAKTLFETLDAGPMQWLYYITHKNIVTDKRTSPIRVSKFRIGVTKEFASDYSVEQESACFKLISENDEKKTDASISYYCRINLDLDSAFERALAPDKTSIVD